MVFHSKFALIALCAASAEGPPTASVHSAIKPITRTANVGGVLSREPALA